MVLNTMAASVQAPGDAVEILLTDFTAEFHDAVSLYSASQSTVDTTGKGSSSGYVTPSSPVQSGSISVSGSPNSGYVGTYTENFVVSSYQDTSSFDFSSTYSSSNGAVHSYSHILDIQLEFDYTLDKNIRFDDFSVTIPLISSPPSSSSSYHPVSATRDYYNFVHYPTFDVVNVSLERNNLRQPYLVFGDDAYLDYTFIDDTFYFTSITFPHCHVYDTNSVLSGAVLHIAVAADLDVYGGSVTWSPQTSFLSDLTLPLIFDSLNVENFVNWNGDDNGLGDITTAHQGDVDQFVGDSDVSDRATIVTNSPLLDFDVGFLSSLVPTSTFIAAQINNFYSAAPQFAPILAMFLVVIVVSMIIGIWKYIQ